MGYLYIDGGLENGKTLGPMEYSTVSCRHCRAVIKILVKGCSREYANTKFRCGRCNGPVCRSCASVMERRGGVCTQPFMAKVEAAIKSGRWDERFEYEYKG